MVGTIKYKTLGSNVINKEMHKYPILGTFFSFVEVEGRLSHDFD
jgi:hypothetical protein